MANNRKFTQREKDLLRRYLVWFYKAAKEDLDKIDRYFTQEMVDDFVLSELKRNKAYQAAKAADAFRTLADGFESYKAEKARRAVEKKFYDRAGRVLSSEYQFLRMRLTAVEKAICRFLGAAQLNKIRRLYEDEMTDRILRAREHR